MTEKSENKKDGKHLLDRFKEEIHAGLEQGSSHIEAERRRLLFRLDEEVKPKKGLTGTTARRFALTSAAAAAVLAVFFLFFVFHNRETRVEEPVSSKTGRRAESARMDGPASVIRTAEDSGESIVLKDESRLWLGPFTEIAVQEKERPIIRMNRGRMLVEVAPVPGEFKVTTPHLAVAVHGTTFSLRVSKKTSIVRLHKGEVELLIEGKKAAMRQGTEVEVSIGKNPKTRPITPEGAMADLMIAQKAGEPTGPPLEKTPQEKNKRAPAPKPAITGKSGPPNQNELQERPVEASKPLFILDDVKVEDVVEENSERIDYGLDDKRSPPVVSPEDALSIGFEQDKKALDSALFARVRALVKSRACASALNAANSYLAIFPEGVHREDVLYFKAFCEARAGNLKKSLDLFEDYLNSYPNGRYWKRINEILGN
jgi:hypothetical protein